MNDSKISRERLQTFARNLRTNQTSAERALWRALRGRRLADFRFRRQVPLCGFIVDFACFEARLIVEVDGATHASDGEIARDKARDQKLAANGNSILRFTNDDVFHNIDGVVETIWRKLQELRPREDSASHSLSEDTLSPSPHRPFERTGVLPNALWRGRAGVGGRAELTAL